MAQTQQQLEADNELLRTRLDRALDSLDSVRMQKMKQLQYIHELERDLKEIKLMLPHGYITK